MAKQPRISDAEWEVMNVLWDLPPASSGEVVERLEGSADWQPKTIKTLLGRLVKKGFVTYEEDGARYLYRPACRRGEIVSDESRSFLDRVFRGDGASLLAHFAQEVDLSAHEAQALRRLLSRGSRPEDAEPGDAPKGRLWSERKGEQGDGR